MVRVVSPPFDTMLLLHKIVNTTEHECMSVLVPATARTNEQISDGRSQVCNPYPIVG